MQAKRNALQQLDRLFKPKTIAVIGASVRSEKIGYAVLKNMLEAGYKGKLYAVNPKYNEVQGQPCVRSIHRVPVLVDLAVITTPARTIPTIVEECGESGVGGVVIISAGFREAGEEGQQLYKQVLDIARKYDIRILGPNSVGIINPHLNLNAAYINRMALKGNIAFVSQSAALCASILDWSVEQHVGFSHFVSVGSMMDVNFADMIDYLGTDNTTSSILIYMESLTEARRFMSAARAFARSKPIIVLKAGKSKEGGAATLSHTGVLAGNDAVYEAAFRRAGVIRVERIAQLFHSAQALAMQPRPRGNRLAIVTNAGGPGVLATDALIKSGGQLANLSDKTMEKLNALLPPNWSKNNPVDVLDTAVPEVFQQALDACLRDENTDGILAIFTPQALGNATETAQAVVKAAKDTRKPILACWMGEQDVAVGRQILEKGKVPYYRYPESAVDVFIKMYDYNRNLQLLYETPSETPKEFIPNIEEARALIHNALEKGLRHLSESESKSLLRCYDIPVTVGEVAQDPAEAIGFADGIGYPVALKIVSRDIVHKSDVGGVELNLHNPTAIKKAFADIQKNTQQLAPEARKEGMLVEKMAAKGYELLLGAHKDPVFGPVIAFGQGGIATEIIQDVQLGLPPLNMALARQIIENTRVYSLLKGYRTVEAVELEQLAFILVKFSYLLLDFPEICEIDINPLISNEHGNIVVDAHVLLDPKDQPRRRSDHHHLVISPYPAKYIRQAKLKDGSDVTLRPIRPEDEPLVEHMFQYLSKESLYYRFFGYVPQVTHEFLARYTQNDYDREIAIIAEIDDEHERKMIGVVRIIADAWMDSAEYAILIADPWQKQGLGYLLTDFILDIARDRGIRKIYASVLATNKGMIHLFEKRGFTSRRDGFDAFYVELEL